MCIRDSWRTDSETPAIAWGLKQAQLTSLAVLLIVVPIFVFAWWRTRARVADPEPVADAEPVADSEPFEGDAGEVVAKS